MTQSGHAWRLMFASAYFDIELAEGNKTAKKCHNEQGEHEYPLPDRKGDYRVQEKAPRSGRIAGLEQFSLIVNRANTELQPMGP